MVKCFSQGEIFVGVPKVCKQEVDWVIDQIFHEFLGVNYTVFVHDGRWFSLGKTRGEILLTFASVFFHQADKTWLGNVSMPNEGIEYIAFSDFAPDVEIMFNKIPIVFGTSEIKVFDSILNVDFDIFGSIFFLLSRYEEHLCHDVDPHQRKPAKSSWVGRNGFLQRPLVNEYILVLRTLCEKVGIRIQPKYRKFGLSVSADVDVPYSHGIKRFSAYSRQIVGDILKRADPKLAAYDALNPFFFHFGITKFDPFYKYLKWMMDVNCDIGNQITFYMMVNLSDHKLNGIYSLEEPIILQLIDTIYERGHLLGIHFSYESYNDINLMQRELSYFQSVINRRGIRLDHLRSRQHFLRWDNRITPVIQDTLGVSQDSTLAFADENGFRSSVCYEYAIYDIEKRAKLALREMPLMFMEASLFEKKYMNKRPNEEALQESLAIKQACKFYDGNFTMLWHNNRFPKKEFEEFYIKLIQP